MTLVLTSVVGRVCLSNVFLCVSIKCHDRFFLFLTQLVNSKELPISVPEMATQYSFRKENRLSDELEWSWALFTAPLESVYTSVSTSHLSIYVV